VNGFGRLLRAEWTKFRTVPGWVIATVVGALAIIALGVGPGMTGSCGKHGAGSECVATVGPEGQEVSDSFYFVHQTLTGDGSITVRVASLTGVLDTGGPGQDPSPGLVPWAKAGLIVKASTTQGSAYAAVLVTGAHGVRMQYDYVHDVAGSPGPAPRWLRLTRTGDRVTGAESTDGTRWTAVGTARLPGLPATVQAGMFATSPQYAEAVSQFGMSGDMGGPSVATGTFDGLGVTGAWSGQEWAGDRIGGSGNERPLLQGGVQHSAGRYTISGSGDIAPSVSGGAGIGTTITQTLVGTFIGLIFVVVVAAMFVTAEYRRGLIRTTVSAAPRRGRILVAKAGVVGAVTFVAGLVAATVVVTIGQQVLRSNGVFVHAAPVATQVRVIVGTAALLAVSAVLALAIGALLRRGAAAVTVAVVVVVLPYLLAIAGLPPGPADWLLRVTPAAAFSLQESAPRYPQVANVYTAVEGFLPLSPLAGFGVLCAYAGAALAAAVLLFRRRDA
jgi:ABC-type transport system involved in multi-copper enzyme maturation permease subunit